MSSKVPRGSRFAPRAPSSFPDLRRDQLDLLSSSTPTPTRATTRAKSPAAKNTRATTRTKTPKPAPPNTPIESFSIGATGANGVTYQLKHIRCGKVRCRTCRSGGAHGPYWYAFTPGGARGKTICTYIGKKLPADVAKERP